MKKLIILLFTVFLSVGSLSAQSTDLKKLQQQTSQDDAEAQYNLGVMYANGLGVPRAYVQAMKWFRLAADQGDASAQYNLGVMYAKGEGIPRDYVQAHMWFNLAAAQGYENGKEGRERAGEMMSPQQIERAQKLARNWKPKKQ